MPLGHTGNINVTPAFFLSKLNKFITERES
jgi:hypothetical protein